MENNPNKEFYPYINNELYQKIKDKFSSATKKNPIVISSYKAMCDLLEEPFKYKTSLKSKQLKEWRYYLNFRISGRQFTVFEVYPVEKAISNAQKVILTNSMNFVTCSFLEQYNKATGKTKLVIPTSNLALNLGFINPTFLEYSKKNKRKELAKKLDDTVYTSSGLKKPFLSDIRKQLKEQDKRSQKSGKENEFVTPQSLKEVDSFYHYIPENYKYQIDSTLNKLESNYVLFNKKTKIGTFIKFNVDIEIPTKEDIESHAQYLLDFIDDVSFFLEWDEETYNDYIKAARRDTLNYEDFISSIFFSARFNKNKDELVTIYSRELDDDEESQYLNIFNSILSRYPSKSFFFVLQNNLIKSFFDELTKETLTKMNGLLFVTNGYTINFGDMVISDKKDDYKQKLLESLDSINSDFESRAKELKQIRLSKNQIDDRNILGNTPSQIALDNLETQNNISQFFFNQLTKMLISNTFDDSILSVWNEDFTESKDRVDNFESHNFEKYNP